jgi:carnitine 3-dehydrogenase
MRHFMAQFGPTLKWPWSKLMDVPEFNEELVDLVAGQSDAQSGMHTIRELERIRDQNLVGFLRVLKERNWGAGKVLLAHDARRREQGADLTGPVEFARMQVLPGWIDYNGHMTESRYLFAASETCDAFLRFIGSDMDYVKSGFSYYTAENHVRHLGEAKLGDALTGTLQVLSFDQKRIHLFIRILRDGAEVATIEQMLLHVDMAKGKTCAAPEGILARVAALAKAHAGLSRPEGAGRGIGTKP